MAKGLGRRNPSWVKPGYSAKEHIRRKHIERRHSNNDFNIKGNARSEDDFTINRSANYRDPRRDPRLKPVKQSESVKDLSVRTSQSEMPSPSCGEYSQLPTPPASATELQAKSRKQSISSPQATHPKSPTRPTSSSSFQFHEIETKDCTKSDLHSSRDKMFRFPRDGPDMRPPFQPQRVGQSEGQSNPAAKIDQGISGVGKDSPNAMESTNVECTKKRRVSFNLPVSNSQSAMNAPASRTHGQDVDAILREPVVPAANEVSVSENNDDTESTSFGKSMLPPMAVLEGRNLETQATRMACPACPRSEKLQQELNELKEEFKAVKDATEGQRVINSDEIRLQKKEFEVAEDVMRQRHDVLLQDFDNLRNELKSIKELLTKQKESQPAATQTDNTQPAMSTTPISAGRSPSVIVPSQTKSPGPIATNSFMTSHSPSTFQPHATSTGLNGAAHQNNCHPRPNQISQAPNTAQVPAASGRSLSMTSARPPSQPAPAVNASTSSPQPANPGSSLNQQQRAPASHADLVLHNVIRAQAQLNHQVQELNNKLNATTTFVTQHQQKLEKLEQTNIMRSICVYLEQTHGFKPADVLAEIQQLKLATGNLPGAANAPPNNAWLQLWCNTIATEQGRANAEIRQLNTLRDLISGIPLRRQQPPAPATAAPAAPPAFSAPPPPQTRPPSTTAPFIPAVSAAPAPQTRPPTAPPTLQAAAAAPAAAAPAVPTAATTPTRPASAAAAAGTAKAPEAMMVISDDSETEVPLRQGWAARKRSAGSAFAEGEEDEDDDGVVVPGRRARMMKKAKRRSVGGGGE